MALITGITGAAADPEVSASDELGPDLPVQGELFADPRPKQASRMMGPSSPSKRNLWKSRRIRGQAWRSAAFRSSAAHARRHENPFAGHLAVHHSGNGRADARDIELKPVRTFLENRAPTVLGRVSRSGLPGSWHVLCRSMDTNLHLLVNEAYDIRAVLYEREVSGLFSTWLRCSAMAPA